MQQCIVGEINKNNKKINNNKDNIGCSCKEYIKKYLLNNYLIKLSQQAKWIIIKSKFLTICNLVRIHK